MCGFVQKLFILINNATRTFFYSAGNDAGDAPPHPHNRIILTEVSAACAESATAKKIGIGLPPTSTPPQGGGYVSG